MSVSRTCTERCFEHNVKHIVGWRGLSEVRLRSGLVEDISASQEIGKVELAKRKKFRCTGLSQILVNVCLRTVGLCYCTELPFSLKSTTRPCFLHSSCHQPHAQS